MLIDKAPALACQLNYITIVLDYCLCVDKLTRMADPLRVVPPSVDRLQRYALKE